MSEVLGRRALAAYGALALPLAFAALPIYVHVPKLYGDELGLSLSLVGAVLLGVRALDAVLDPLLGWWSDRWGRRRLLIGLSLPLLALGMLGLLRPPAEAVGAGWLALVLTLVCLGFSLASINYYAWGAELSHSAHERTRITASREAFALAGVVTAAVVPGYLGADLANGLARSAVLFVLLLALAAAITLAVAPAAQRLRPEPAGMLVAVRDTLRNRPFAWLLAVFAANGIAAAIPATLVLFFVSDVLDLDAWAGMFLGVYFLAGIAALPAWVAAARRYGKVNSWLASMALAMGAFVFAFFLESGDLAGFVLICAITGAALGADLSLPPSMLADVIDRDPRGGSGAKAGAYFGVWTFFTKLNLALAAGIALPLLAALGYTPGEESGGNTIALAAVYALLPIPLKALAAIVLWRRRIDMEVHA